MYILLVSYALFCLCQGRTQSIHIKGYEYTEISPFNKTQPPTSRMNFGLGASSEWIYLFGGVLPDNDATYVEDVWAFNTGHINSWNKTKITLKRSAHCVAQITNDTVYIVGGTGDPEAPTFLEVNLTSARWNLTLPTLPAPHIMFPACTTIVEPKQKQSYVVAFGGCSQAGVCTNNISFYSSMNNSWTTFKSDKNGPPAVEGATLTSIIYTDRDTNKISYYLVVIGGSPFNQTESLLYAFNLTSEMWLKPMAIPKLPHLAYHTTVKTKDGNMIVFGGISSNSMVNPDTYIVEYSPMSKDINVTVLPSSNITAPVGRRGHAAFFEFNRMLLYGGDINVKDEDPGNMWQFVVEKECLDYTTCGDCLLGGCYFCNPNATKHNNSYCVAGKHLPYIASTCPFPGWDIDAIRNCRPDIKAPLGLTIGTIISVIIIFILVVAVYIVDWKKGKATSGGYEPIGGM